MSRCSDLHFRTSHAPPSRGCCEGHDLVPYLVPGFQPSSRAPVSIIFGRLLAHNICYWVWVWIWRHWGFSSNHGVQVPGSKSSSLCVLGHSSVEDRQCLASICSAGTHIGHFGSELAHFTQFSSILAAKRTQNLLNGTQRSHPRGFIKNSTG